MDLFRKVSHRKNVSIWANTPNNNDSHGDKCGSGLKCDINNSMTSQETMMYEPSSPSPSYTYIEEDDINVVTQRNLLLERALREKDGAISQLRNTMEASEKIQSERIELLEHQLERLVELPSGERECQGKVAVILLRSPNSKNIQILEEYSSSQKPRDSQNDSHQGGLLRHRPQLEMAALEELLTRVIAEKDRLGFENKNLRSLLKQRNFVDSNNGSCMPPSIVELDSMINKEHKKNCQEKSSKYCQDSFNPNHECREETNQCPSATVAKEPQLHSVVYQLSCRHCPRDRAIPRCLGAFTPTNQTDSKRELTRILKAHFSHVWKAIQDESHSRSSSTHDEEQNHIDNCSFQTSSLARHLVKHCKSFSKKEEVLQWCMDNIKVEIQSTNSKEKRVPSSTEEKKKGQSTTSKKTKKNVQIEC